MAKFFKKKEKSAYFYKTRGHAIDLSSGQYLPYFAIFYEAYRIEHEDQEFYYFLEHPPVLIEDSKQQIFSLKDILDRVNLPFIQDALYKTDSKNGLIYASWSEHI